MVTAYVVAEAFGIGTYWVAAVVAIAINLAIAMILGKILAPDFDGDARDTKGLQMIIKSNIAPRRVAYGECITGGPYVILDTVGTENQIWQLGVVLTGHPIEDVLGVFIDDEYVDISGTGGTTNDSGNNLDANYRLRDTKFGYDSTSATQDPNESLVKIIKCLGWGYADISYVTDYLGNQDVLDDRARAELISEELDVTGVGKGKLNSWKVPTISSGGDRDAITGLYPEGKKLTNCAYIYMHFKFDPDVFSGYPSVKFHIKGKRLYNPNLDSDSELLALGADGGSHDLLDPDTYEWSDNWALCVLDYLLNKFYGLGAKTKLDTNALLKEIDWQEAIQAVKDSDDIITNGLPSPQTDTGPRYTTNGLFEVSSTPISIMESLLTSGAGKLVYAQGKYKIFAGKYRAPNLATDIINEDMIVGSLNIRTHTPRSQLFNKAAGVYVSKGYDDTLPIQSTPKNALNLPTFEPSDFVLVDPLDSSGTNPYEEIDGEEIIRDFDYPFTINNFEAQRLARIQLERIRRGITIEFEANLKILKFSVGDTVYLEILSDSKYANENFFNKLGFDDTVQNRPDSPGTAYYKQFTIIDMQYTENFTIQVSMLEEAEEIYDWNVGDASIDESEIVSNVPGVSPTAVILPPTFLLISGTPVTELISWPNLSTVIKWDAPERSSPDAESIDRDQISGYRLEYGIVTDPSNANPELRVEIWNHGGTVISKPPVLLQGPIVLENLFVDINTSFDFRIRSVVYSGRASAWAYYSVEMGTDFTPSSPESAQLGSEYGISLLYDTQVTTLTASVGWNPGEFRFNQGFGTITDYKNISSIELCILTSDNINQVEVLEHIRWNDTIIFHISSSRWYKFKYVNSSPYNGQPGYHATSYTITDPTKIVYRFIELVLIDFKDDDPTNVSMITTPIEFRLSNNRSDDSITAKIDGKFIQELPILDGVEDCVSWYGWYDGPDPKASNLVIGAGKNGSNAWFLQGSDGAHASRWTKLNSIVMFKTAGFKYFNVTITYSTLQGTSPALDSGNNTPSFIIAELLGNNIPNSAGATSPWTNRSNGTLLPCDTNEWKTITIPCKVPAYPNDEWAYIQLTLYVSTIAEDATIEVLIDSINIEPHTTLNYTLAILPYGSPAKDYSCPYSVAQNFVIDLQDTGAPNGHIGIGGATPEKAEINVEVTQGSVLRSMSWEANGNFTNIKWAGGTAPTITQVNNAVDLFTFRTLNSGATWVGSAIQNIS